MLVVPSHLGPPKLPRINEDLEKKIFSKFEWKVTNLWPTGCQILFTILQTRNYSKVKFESFDGPK